MRATKNHMTNGTFLSIFFCTELIHAKRYKVPKCPFLDKIVNLEEQNFVYAYILS